MSHRFNLKAVKQVVARYDLIEGANISFDNCKAFRLGARRGGILWSILAEGLGVEAKDE